MADHGVVIVFDAGPLDNKSQALPSFKKVTFGEIQMPPTTSVALAFLLAYAGNPLLPTIVVKAHQVPVCGPS